MISRQNVFYIPEELIEECERLSEQTGEVHFIFSVEENTEVFSFCDEFDLTFYKKYPESLRKTSLFNI